MCRYYMMCTNWSGIHVGLLVMTATDLDVLGAGQKGGHFADAGMDNLHTLPRHQLLLFNRQVTQVLGRERLGLVRGRH